MTYYMRNSSINNWKSKEVVFWERERGNKEQEYEGYGMENHQNIICINTHLNSAKMATVIVYHNMIKQNKQLNEWGFMKWFLIRIRFQFLNTCYV